MTATKERRDELSRKRKAKILESIMDVRDQYQQLYPDVDEMLIHNICMSAWFKVKDHLPY